MKSSEKSLYDTGTILRHADIECLSEKFCKVAGFGFFLLTLILMILIDINNCSIVKSRKKDTVIQGMPVYDLQQI